MENIQIQANTASAEYTSEGYCPRCTRQHRLGPGQTRHHCLELMHRLERFRTIDLFSTQPQLSRDFGTASLFGPARGKMFGVMECMQADGTTIMLYAFSGQFNGSWLIEGWAPPLFKVKDFLHLSVEKEKQIKELGRAIGRCSAHSNEWLRLKKKRRLFSRKLMQDIHSLYRLTNFRGETSTLNQAFIGSNGIPTGTGDCCAPKLLNFAAKNNLRPLGLSEFFWGKENKSRGRQHGFFTASCIEKCRPILGFMLCGLDTAGR